VEGPVDEGPNHEPGSVRRGTDAGLRNRCSRNTEVVMQYLTQNNLNPDLSRGMAIPITDRLE